MADMKPTLRCLIAAANLFAVASSEANAPLSVQIYDRSVRIGNTNAEMDFGISSVPSAVSLVVRPGLSDRLAQGTAIRLKSLDFGYQPDAHGTTHARNIELSLDGVKYVSRPVNLVMSESIVCSDGKSADRLVYSFEDSNCALVVGTAFRMSFLDDSGREMERVRYKVVPDSDSVVDDIYFSAHGKTYRPLVQLVGELVRPEPAVASAPVRSSGRIKVRTVPAEVRVLLDGRFAGKTPPGPQDDGASGALVLDDVSEGEHTLLMQHSGYEDLSVSVKVARGKTTTVNKRVKPVFHPDIEVVSNGHTYRGVLVSKTADYVTIETKPGVQRCFPTADVMKLVNIGRPAK